MIEVLLHPRRVVALVRTPGEAVVLADVLEQDDRLPEPAERVVVLDALGEVDRAVLVVVQDHQRRLHVLRKEHR